MRYLSLLLIVTLSACANATLARSLGALPPGAGVTPDAIAGACSSPAEYDAHLTRAQARVREGDWPRPQVGASACQVLAELGAPDDQRTVSTPGGQELHWAYRSGSAAAGSERLHLVVLQGGPDGRGRVAAVVW